MSLAFPLLFGGFVVLVIVVAAVSIYAQKKRREAFATLAARHGWSYVQRDDRWAETFNGPPFHAGHGRRAENIIGGTYEGRTFVAFDYSYRTTSSSTDANGNHTTHDETHRFAVAALQLECTFPALHVSPEGFLGRAIGRLTNRDIELESEDFNRAFTVTCPERKFASDVLHPRLMETLLAQYRNLDWRFDGAWLLSVDNGSHDIDTTLWSLKALGTIVSTVPEFVWQDRGRPARGPADEPPSTDRVQP